VVSPNALGGTNPHSSNSANFTHKQRQLNYSPNLTASKLGNKITTNSKSGKRGVSENTQDRGANSQLGNAAAKETFGIQGVTNKRSQSKNDKHMDIDINPNKVGAFNFLNPNTKS